MYESYVFAKIIPINYEGNGYLNTKVMPLWFTTAPCTGNKNGTQITNIENTTRTGTGLNVTLQSDLTGTV